MQIRLATPGDGAAVRDIYAPSVTSSAISFELTVPSVAQMSARIAERLPRLPWLVGESGGVVVGYAYASRFHPRAAYEWSVETSVYVAVDHQGRGVGRALYTALFAVLGAQGYRQAMAGIALPNPGSVALHEGSGFALVGVYRAVGWKFGVWHDVGWWQRPIDPGSGPPTDPLDVAQLDPAVLAAAFRDAGSAA